jgi:hypothetical protein
VNPPYTAESRAFLLTPDGMAQLVAHLLETNGEVTCEPLTSSEPGEQTTCTATLLLGIESTVVVEVQTPGSDQVPLAIISTASN